MPATTVSIECDVSLPTSLEFTSATFKFRLSEPDYDTLDNETITTTEVTAVANGSGVATVSLWPVDRGVRNSFYRVVLSASIIVDGAPQWSSYTLGVIRPPSTGAPHNLADLLAQSSGGIIVGSTIYATLADAVQAALDAAAAGSDPVAAIAARDAAIAAADDAETAAAAASAAAAQFSLYNLDNMTELLADVTMTYTPALPGTVIVGEIVRTRAEGLAYQVASATATDHHVTTAGGVRLRMLQTPQSRGSLLQFAGAKGVLVHVGDSTLLGAAEWGVAYKSDWMLPGGIFEGWTSFNLAKNGSPTSTWVTSIASGDQNAAPVDYVGVGNPTENVWQAVNAKPDVIVIGLGTNDVRMTGTQTDPQFAETLRQLRVNYHRLINFFLEKTSAEIWIRLNAPIAFANPDPGGFTNFTTTAQAARASAGMRTVALEWQCVSERVRVWDTHKALFGLQIDSVPSAVDPEGQIDFSSMGVDYGLMKDTLHPTNLGWQRVCQIVSRAVVPSRHRTTAVMTAPSAVRNGAVRSVLIEVKEVGAGYVDVFANSIRRLAGDLTRNRGRGPVNNVSQAEALLAAGYASDFRDLLRSTSFSIGVVTGASAGEVTTGYTWTYNAVDGVADYYRITGTITGTVVAGWAMAYVTDPVRLPRHPLLEAPIQIQIGGAVPLTSGAASGAVPIPSTGAFPQIDANTVSGTRRNSSGAATVDLYLCNRFDGAYVNPVGGAVLSAAPGHRLGQVTFPSGHLGVTSWAKDATNYPSGNPVPVYTLNTNTFVVAVLTSGGMGDAGTIMIRAR